LKFFCFFLPFFCFSDLNRVFFFRFFLSFSLKLEKPTKQNQQQVDSIGSARGGSGGGGGDSEVQRTMLELLNQLDGFESTNKIKVLMATNRIDILDAALLRPGRIDRKIEFPNPSESSRVDILRIHSRKMNLVRGIDLQKVADKMGGASGKEGEREEEREVSVFFFFVFGSRSRSKERKTLTLFLLFSLFFYQKPDFFFFFKQARSSRRRARKRVSSSLSLFFFCFFGVCLFSRSRFEGKKTHISKLSKLFRNSSRHVRAEGAPRPRHPGGL